MSRIVVVAIGPGNPKFMLQSAIERLQKSDLIIGSARQVEDIQEFLPQSGKTHIYKKIQEIQKLIEEYSEEEISIVVSGDSGYYSLVPYLSKKLRENFTIIPGISSFQYLFAKIGENWQNYLLASVHGRKIDYQKYLEGQNHGIVLLTDEEENPKKIAKALVELGFRGITLIVGENLSYSNEKISIYEIEKWQTMPDYFAMNVCICKKGEDYAYL